MKGVRLARAAARAEDLAGRVLARDLRDEAGRIALGKGTVLDDGALAAIAHLPWDELHLVEPAPGDVHEREAGARLARAAAGPGVAVATLAGGAWPLSAMHRGLLAVDVRALDEVNAVEGLCLYTLYHGQVVEADEPVARAKIVPFVLAEQQVACGEAIAGRSGGIVSVRPFQQTRIGAVVQESLGPRAMARVREALAEKVEWFGSTLMDPVFVPPVAAALVDGLHRLLDAGAQVVTLAGSRPMDPLDPAFEALGRIGATMVRHGVPAHPGSLFWLARVGEIPIIGVPSCGLFSQATVLDLVLPRLLAGEPLDARQLASMGHGGFLTRDMAFRFPPYRHARERGAVE